MNKVRLALVALAALTVTAVAAGGARERRRGDDQLQKIKHIVVIYEENHSFDNLYGGWEGVNGRAERDARRRRRRSTRTGSPYTCLMQLDVNLTSPPLSTDVHGRDATASRSRATS